MSALALGLLFGGVTLVVMFSVLICLLPGIATGFPDLVVGR